MKNGIMKCIFIMCFIVPFFVLGAGAETFTKSYTVSLTGCRITTPSAMSVVNISYGHTGVEGANPSARWARIDIDYEDNLEYIPNGLVRGQCSFDDSRFLNELYAGSITFSGKFWFPYAEPNTDAGFRISVQYELDGEWKFIEPSIKKETASHFWTLEFTVDFEKSLRIGFVYFNFTWDRSMTSSQGFFYIKQDWDIVNTYSTYAYQEAFKNEITGAIDDLASQTASQFYMQNQVIGEAASNIGGAIRDSGSQVASTIINEDYGYTKPNTSTIDQGVSTAGNIADTVTGHLEQFNTIRQDSVEEIQEVAENANGALSPIWGIFTGVILAFFIIGCTFLVIRKVLGR